MITHDLPHGKSFPDFFLLAIEHHGPEQRLFGVKVVRQFAIENIHFHTSTPASLSFLRHQPPGFRMFAFRESNAAASFFTTPTRRASSGRRRRENVPPGHSAARRLDTLFPETRAVGLYVVVP